MYPSFLWGLSISRKGQKPMILQSLRHHIDLIDSILPPSKSEELAIGIQNLVRASDERGWLTDTYVDTAVLNGIYALVRHLPWHETPIFQELLVEYLRCELNIPIETAIRIYELGKTTLSQYRPKLFPEMEVDADRHFLRYLFIASAIAKDEIQLAADLGLGCGVLKRIKTAANWIVARSSQAKQGHNCEPNEFIPAMDVCFAETMLDFTREMRKVPWTVDLHRFKYRLLEVHAPWREKIESVATESLFGVLLELAADQVIKLRFDETDVERALALAKITEFSGAEFIQILESIHILSNSREKGFKPRFCLTPFGEDLTADAYVLSAQRLEKCEMSEVARMPIRYQSAWVRSMPSTRIAELRTYVASLRDKAFAPPALEQAVRRLSLALGAAEIVQICEAMLNSCKSPYLQKAVLAGLNDKFEQKAVRQFLQKVAESGVSVSAADTRYGNVAVEFARMSLLRTRAVGVVSNTSEAEGAFNVGLDV